MTDQNPAGTAVAYFEALGRGDIPAVMAMFDPGVVWHQPGANRFSGVHHGIDGVSALLGGMMQVSNGTFQVTVTGPAMTNGDLVAVPVQFSGNRQGVSMDIAGIDLLTIRHDSIAEVHLFSVDGPAEDTFWGTAP